MDAIADDDECLRDTLKKVEAAHSVNGRRKEAKNSKGSTTTQMREMRLQRNKDGGVSRGIIFASIVDPFIFHWSPSLKTFTIFRRFPA